MEKGKKGKREKGKKRKREKGKKGKRGTKKREKRKGKVEKRKGKQTLEILLAIIKFQKYSFSSFSFIKIPYCKIS